MGADDSHQTESDLTAPDGFSFDSENPRYRQFANRDGILEYTFEGAELTIDWVCGRNASFMIQDILGFEGASVRKISGYVTDKLGAAPDAVLERLGNLLARRLSGGWTAAVERIEGRRYLVLTR